MKTDSQQASLMAWAIFVIGVLVAGYFKSVSVLILVLIILYWWRISDFIDKTDKSIEEIKRLLKEGSR